MALLGVLCTCIELLTNSACSLERAYVTVLILSYFLEMGVTLNPLLPSLSYLLALPVLLPIPPFLTISHQSIVVKMVLVPTD